MQSPLISMQKTDTRSAVVTKTATLSREARKDLELLMEATIWSNAAFS